MNKASSQSLMPPLWILTVLSAAAALWLAAQLKEIVMLLVLGYSAAYILDGPLKRLERIRIPRAGGFFVILAVLLAVIFILGLTAFPTISREFTKLSHNLPQYAATAQEKIKPWLSDLVERFAPEMAAEKIVSPLELLKGAGADTLKRVLQAAWAALLSGYSVTLTLVNLALFPFIAFYLAVDLPRLHAGILNLFPPARRKKVEAIAREIDFHLAGFVRGQLLVGCILSCLFAIGLGLLGVELWFLLALLSGFGNFVPYLGTMVGVLLSSIMALVTFGDFFHLLAVWGIYAVVQVLEGNFITPRVMGRRVGLSPLTVILAIFAGGKLFGLLGILLAVPAAAVLKVAAAHLYKWVLARPGL